METTSKSSAPSSPSARADQAHAKLDAAHAALVRDTAGVRARLRRQRAAWILGGGFASGLALTILPTRFWARVGAVLGGVAAFSARSALTPIVAGALMSRINSTIESDSEKS